MKLSRYFNSQNLIRDNEFMQLGYVDSKSSQVLAYADNLKYLQAAAKNPNISCLIVTPELSLSNFAVKLPGLVASGSPREAFYKIHSSFIDDSLYHFPFKPGIGVGCKIHPTAIISEGCRIGDNVIIGEQVVIRECVWIGSGVIIEPGVKIGVEGILYNRTSSGIVLIPHAGYVRIHDNVNLMTNSIVVRSIHNTDVTEIGKGSLIGLASIIGHEANIGTSVVISNQCLVARKSRIGNDCFLGTNVMVKEHVYIGKKAHVFAGSVVISDVAENSSVSGNFATDHKKRMLDLARMKFNR